MALMPGPGEPGGDASVPHDASAYPFRFSCKRSGNCCTRPEGRVRLAAEDIPKIAELLGLSVDGLRSRFLDPGPEGSWLVRMQPGGACPWFARVDGHGRCEVYAARPAHCRSFPFWPELRQDGPALREAARFCPGIALSNPAEGTDV